MAIATAIAIAAMAALVTILKIKTHASDAQLAPCAITRGFDFKLTIIVAQNQVCARLACFDTCS